MQVESIKLNREKARELYQQYRAHKGVQTEQDAEIEQTYKLIAEGHTVLQAVASIKAAGLNEQRLPRLAIARADAAKVWWRTQWRGGRFSIDSWPRGNQARSRRVIVRDWDVIENSPSGEAMVLIVPVYLRPRQALEKYHILFEAEWRPLPPVDPYLLRHVSGDLWLVVAAWELTDVERAAMAHRVNG
ncbi:MAG: hypothetical protein ACREUX_13905 [Burkholderiales bacterium]